MNLNVMGVVAESAMMGFVPLDGYAYAKEITVPANSIDADCPWFPLDVYLREDAVTINSVVHPANFVFSRCKADGSDVRFTDKSKNLLKFERKEHNATTKIAHYVVLAPLLSDLTDTKIYMHYGNPNAYNDSIEAWQDKTGKQLTYNGNVKLVPNAAKFGKAAYFDGTGDYISIPASTDFAFDGVDATIRTFICTTASTGDRIIYADNEPTNMGTYFTVTNGKLYFNNSNGTTNQTVMGITNVADGKLHYVVLRKVGNVVSIYCDNNLEGSVTLTAWYRASTNAITIGGRASASSMFIGYIDELEIAKGIARTTEMPTSPFVADQYTKLLLHFDGAKEKYLYNLGDECASITGGWSAVGASDGYTATAPTLTKNMSDMTYSLTASGVNRKGVITTNNPIDLTEYKTLSILHKGTLSTYNNAAIIVMATGDINAPTYTALASTIMVYASAVTTYTQINVDVSAITGAHKVFIVLQVSVDATSCSGNCAKVWLSTPTFTDETGKTVTTYGDVKPIKTAYADGARGAYFGGAGDYFSLPNNIADFNFLHQVGTNGKWTAEFRYKANSFASDTYLFDNIRETPVNYGVYIVIAATRAVWVCISRGSSTNWVIACVSGAGVYPNDFDPHKIAVDYDQSLGSNNCKIFIDNVLVYQATKLGNVPSSSPANQIPFIGAGTPSADFMNGCLLGMRISNGVCRGGTVPDKFDVDQYTIFATNFDTIYDQNYAMVQHMGDTLVDATGNGNNGTATGTTVVNTEFGKVRQFSNNCITVPLNMSTTNQLSAATLMGTSYTTTDSIIIEHSADFNAADAFMLSVSTTTGRINVMDNDELGVDHYNGGNTNNNFADGVLHCAYAKIDRTQNGANTTRLFMDGVLNYLQVFSYDTTGNFSNQTLYIGKRGGTSIPFYGIIAETRLSNTARSDAWIKAESLALNDTLLTFADAE